MVFADAIDLLYGRARCSLTDFRAELAAVTVEDLREVAGQAMSTLLLQVPRGNLVDWAGFAEAPMWSAKATTGGEFPSLQKKDFTLVLGYDGVSLVSPHGVLTVLYSECVLMQCWPDGARRLVGADAVSVSIEPNLYDVSAETIAGVDELVPDELKVWQPARSADRIPQRPAPAAPPAPPAAQPPVVRRSKIALLIFGGLAVFLLLAAAGSMVDLLTYPDDNSARQWWLTLVFLWIGGIFLALVVAGLRGLRGPRRRR
jgi:hypothetical protein